MTILHLGVIDLPYAEPTETKPKKVAQARRGKANKPLGKKEPAQSSNQTTGDVAEILEAKYHIMEIFFESYADNITDAIEHSLVNAVETLFTHNGPPPDNPYAGAASE